MPLETHVLQTLSSSEAQEAQQRHSVVLDKATSPLLLEEASLNEDYTSSDSQHHDRRSFTKSIEYAVRRSSIIDDSEVPDMWSR